MPVLPLPVFIAGADLSHLCWLEPAGAVYRDAGRLADPIALCRRRGLNLVRLRLYAGSDALAAADPFNSAPVLAQLLPLARRVRAAGMRYLLDLHYTDQWADPGKQGVPAIWAGLSGAGLAAALEAWNRQLFELLIAEDLLPEMVQVGNEITNGMLWPHGRIEVDQPATWNACADLLTAAIRGIRAAAGAATPPLCIHLDRGGDWESTRRFIDRISERGVPWDVLGQSYYPFWHGTPAQLGECLVESARRWRKPVLLAEFACHHVACPDERSAAFSETPADQAARLREIVEVVRAVPDGLGMGVIWWGAEYVPVGHPSDARLNARSCFARDGEALPVLAALGAAAVEA
jgi:arabinogalactan endo-1,4-beta-galactosidase